LVLNWFNKGLHVNMREDGEPGCLRKRVGEDDLAYARDYGDIAPGRIGNGVREYDVPLADGNFRTGMLVAENLICRSETRAKNVPAVQVKDPSKPAVLEFRMPSSYVYLTGTLTFQAVVPKGGQIRVFFSDNNGLDWKELVTVTNSGERKVDLSPLVLRRYDYRLSSS
jgi:hypothetical protein